MLHELVENALAALPERGGQFGLRATPTADGEGFSLEVADNGSGVNAGLHLSRAVAEAHGGTFVVESEPRYLRADAVAAL